MMRFSVFVLCVGVAAAVQYNDLKDVISQSSVHTIRLAEISAKVESQGPMDQVGSLCFKQMREIATEIDELDTTHQRFTRNCLSTLSTYNTQINGLSLEVASADRRSADWSVKWNNLRPRIPPIRRKREKHLASMNKLEADLVKKKEQRDATKAIYDTDMLDFASALKDIAELNKILNSGALGDKKTSGAVAREGFLQAVDKVQSDRLRQMSNRFALAAEFLDQEEDASAPNGVDKISKLLLQIRNEMWAEMDKLTKNEAVSISEWKQLKLTQRRRINALALTRARLYIKIGHILSLIGKQMIKEADERILSARKTKDADKITISKHFLEDSCNAEPPMFQKSRSVKLAEVSTIEKMLKVLRGLKWSGAVYNAISRITVGGVDENPEPGYVLGFQMDVHLGLYSNNYAINNRDTKDFGRVAVKLQVGTSWVWASFDAWSSAANRYLVPTKANGIVNQRYVQNLRIHKSASAKVASRKDAAQGNVEMWAGESGKKNTYKVPGASDGLFDFGDERLNNRKYYGSFQVHDYLQKQTVLAVNNFFDKGNHDVGIGSQSGRGTQPDWTGAKNSGKYSKRKEAVTLSWYYQHKGYDQKLKTKSTK